MTKEIRIIHNVTKNYLIIFRYLQKQ